MYVESIIDALYQSVASGLVPEVCPRGRGGKGRGRQNASDGKPHVLTVLAFLKGAHELKRQDFLRSSPSSQSAKDILIALVVNTTQFHEFPES